MFVDLGPRELGSLFDIAYKGLEAAATLTWGGVVDSGWVDRLPINAALLRHEQSGARAMLTIEVIPPTKEFDRAVRLTVLAVGDESLGDMRQLARDELARRLRASPGGFGFSEPEADDIAGWLERGSGDVSFLFGERRS